MSIITIIALGIVAGLLFIHTSIKQAEVDPQNFDHFNKNPRYKKPAGWKTGKLPASLKNTKATMKNGSQIEFFQILLSQN
jgi:hypothetical protein